VTTETTRAPIAGLTRIGQVKLPVTDLARSVAWYRDLLGLRLWVEFVEDGVLRGAGLIDDHGRFAIALRERDACAGRPSLDGFDVVAFQPDAEEVLHELVARCERLGVVHGGIRRTPDGAVLDVPDPDGTVLRFYHYTGALTGFTGVETRDGAYTGRYDVPRLG
jgi:catechol 2,3-dioxygenase-like lactoylglutathione lyase family enzyme